jgi:anti-anti-sigma factor
MPRLGGLNRYLPRWLERPPEAPPEFPLGTSGPARAAEPAFAIEVERRDSGVRVALRGELDYDTCPAFRDELDRLEAEQPRLLLLDLRNLSFMDSSGLRELASAVRRGRRQRRRVVLVKGSSQVDSVLEITRAEDAMETVVDPAAVGFADIVR